LENAMEALARSRREREEPALEGKPAALVDANVRDVT
jgi:hypothetical protein